MDKIKTILTIIGIIFGEIILYFFTLIPLILYFYNLEQPQILIIVPIFCVPAIIVSIKRHKYIQSVKEDSIISPTSTRENQNLTNVLEPSKYKKKKLMTANELKWYCAIKQILPLDYILQPQINLATIIEKTDNSRYANELFRNIDFGIFDTYGNVLVVIEINDSSHTEWNRIERDCKVKNILEEANIPLITFWTSHGINQSYIEKRIKEYI